nr:EAL domain-containing protein [uncultured Cohaesibacter sp.]
MTLSRLITPTFRISFGLVGITLSLFMTAFVIGMYPDQERQELKYRADFAEALALQLSAAASQYDVKVMRQTIDMVVSRNPELLSVGLRRNDGKLLLWSGEHEANWVEPGNHRSTPTHIQVSLSDENKVWGRIEMSFAPMQMSKRYFGIPSSMGKLLLFVCCLGLAGYYFVLRRALKELDPGNVIPDRVQSAFNSLAEGVLILDERGIILLANDALAISLGISAKALFGNNVSKLNWRQWNNGGRVVDYPWQEALHRREDITGARLSFKGKGGSPKNFVVNATCIRGDGNQVSGVIVTLDDVTELERKNVDLEAAVQKLQLTEEEISKQNRELQYLASHDPLTGCLNRRAFFEQFAIMLADAGRNHSMLVCMMADLDHFKLVNDTYGHAVGDKVIVGMAEVLQQACGIAGLVGRYGGEEFCLVLPNTDAEGGFQVAEAIREAVAQRSPLWLGHGNKKVTASIGLSMLPERSCSAAEIVDRADQALYQAKETGRDKVVFWDDHHASGSEAAYVEKPLVEKGDLAQLSAPPQLAALASGSAVYDEADKGASKQLLATDPLTGLPSDVIFLDRLTQSISRAEWSDKTVALLNVSIDTLEEISAAYGEDVATDFVAVIASRFKSSLKRSDTIATLDGAKRIPSICHLSNDNFLVELSDLEETSTIVWIVKRLFESLSAPITVKNEVLYATSNIGISLFPGDGHDTETLMRNAAMARQYAQKQEGNNNYQFFCEEMNRNSRQQIGLEASIRQALEEDLFLLHFQPIVDVHSGQVEAMECLLRSKHPNFGGVPIGSLIAVAEQRGLIVEIGEWVLKSAIQHAEAWIAKGIDVPLLSINLSAVQLNSDQAMERLLVILSRMRIPATKLQFEVTETAILRDSEAAAEALSEVRKLGVSIALDDFGTGQSSLGYLRRFQPDILKIDRCFIGEITTSHADETLVSAIVSMAQRLQIDVVAEGVETEKQVKKVAEIGCNAIQGFYFSRPMAPEATEKWMEMNLGVDLMADVWTEDASSDQQAIA